MFLDASVIVAVLTEEPDAEALSSAIEQASGLFTSPVGLFEAVVAIARKGRLEPELVRRRVEVWLHRAQIHIRSIDPEVGSLALAVHARYGKGSGQPARPNLGDCFAYAMAKQHGVQLLYQGDDFARTDLA